MTPRPKHTGKDKNHAPIRNELRGDALIVIDVADLPGDPEHNPLDQFVLDPAQSPIPVIVACSADGIRRWFAEHPGQALVQVEIKPHAGARFTEDEKTYFRSLGLWPPKVWV